MSDKRMNLYVVTNGWTGESYVRVYVVAATEARALELARESFKREHDDPRNWETLFVNHTLALDGSEYASVPSDSGWESADE